MLSLSMTNERFGLSVAKDDRREFSQRAHLQLYRARRPATLNEGGVGRVNRERYSGNPAAGPFYLQIALKNSDKFVRVAQSLDDRLE
jgi:hypothetical protein